MASRDDIAALHALGWTDAAIGRAVGRDSSLIHQIAVGAKPGRNLTPALDALRARGVAGPASAREAPRVAGPLPPTPRRTRASGQPARVREGAQYRRWASSAPPRKWGRELPNGQRQIEGSTKRSARFAASMAQAQGDSARIKVSWQDQSGRWHTFGAKGGMTPQALRELMQGRTWRQTLTEMAAMSYGRSAAGSQPSGVTQFYIA